MHVDALTGSLVYLDTNVFIYAAEGFKRHELALRALLLRIDDGSVMAVTSEVTIMEVLVRPLREHNVGLISYYEQLLGHSSSMRVAPIDRSVLRRAADLRANSAVKPIDALHVATAQLSHCDYFISDDRKLNAAAFNPVAVEDLQA